MDIEKGREVLCANQSADSKRFFGGSLSAFIPDTVVTHQSDRKAAAREKVFTEFCSAAGASAASSAGHHLWSQEGRVFSVLHRGVRFFPSFQFDDERQPIPVVAEVVRRLLGKTSEWGIALWFTANNGWLGGRRPVDLLRSDPLAVLKAADQEIAELVF